MTADTIPSKQTRPSSAKQRRASRINGQKSQGPKTPEGKAKSRLNAMTHGFTAGRAAEIHDEHRERAQQRFELWAEDLNVQGPVQEFFLDQAVKASLRLQAIDLQIELGQSFRLAYTEQDIERLARQEAEALGKELANNGPKILPELYKTVAGCEYLVGRWMKLANALTEIPNGLEGAISVWHDLTGKYRPTMLNDAPLIEDFNKKAQLACTAEEPVREFCRELFNGAGVSAEDLAAFQLQIEHPGSIMMIDFALQIFGAIRQLEAKADALEEIEGPRREKAVADGIVDTSPEGNLLNRYLKDAERSVRMNLNAVRQEQALAARSEAPSTPKRNEPGARNIYTEPVGPQKLSDIQLAQKMAFLDKYVRMIDADMDDCSEGLGEDEANPEAPEAPEPPPEPPKE